MTRVLEYFSLEILVHPKNGLFASDWLVLNESKPTLLVASSLLNRESKNPEYKIFTLSSAVDVNASLKCGFYQGSVDLFIVFTGFVNFSSRSSSKSVVISESFGGGTTLSQFTIAQ